MDLRVALRPLLFLVLTLVYVDISAAQAPFEADFQVVTDLGLGYVQQSETATGLIRRLDPTGPGSPKGVAVDQATKDVYYTDNSDRKVKVLRWATKTVEIIFDAGAVSPQAYLRGVAVDMGRGVVYYADTNTSKIVEVTVATKATRDVQTGIIAHSLVFDKANKKLYWSQTGSKIGIYSCSSTDANPASTGVVTENIVNPSGLDIDFVEGKLYWVERDLHSIECMYLNGTGRKQIRKEVYWKGPFHGLSVTTNFVFFVEENHNALRGFERHTNEFHQYPEQTFENMYDTASSNDNKDLCMRNFKKCSTGPGCVYINYICDGEPDCMDGSDEGALCTGGKKAFLTNKYLVVADDSHSSLFQVDPVSGAIVYLPTDDLTMPWTVAVNQYTGDIYFADDAEGKIAVLSASTWNTTTVKKFENEIASFGSLCLDADANILYFTMNEAPGYIAQIDLKDNSLKFIYKATASSVILPRTGLFLDKGARKLYWSDSALHGIYTISVDTAGAQPVKVLGGIDDPDGFYVDFKKQEMFWANSNTSSIDHSPLDGSNVGTIRQLPKGDGRQFRSLTVDDTYIYYTDTLSSSVNRVNRATKAVEVYADQGFASLSAIRYVEIMKTSTTAGPITMPTGPTGQSTLKSGSSGPSMQSGGPSGPSTQGGGPTGGGPSGPSTQGGGPSGASTQGGPTGGGPSGPSTQGAGPSGPSTNAGGPTGPQGSTAPGPSGGSTMGGSQTNAPGDGGSSTKIPAIVIPIAVFVGATIILFVAYMCSRSAVSSVGMASASAGAGMGGYNPYGQGNFGGGGARRNQPNYGYRLA